MYVCVFSCSYFDVRWHHIIKGEKKIIIMNANESKATELQRQEEKKIDITSGNAAWIFALFHMHTPKKIYVTISSKT